MNSLITFLNTAGKSFIGFSLPMLIQSSVLIVVLLVLDLFLRRKFRAVFRYCIWMLVLVKLVLPTTLSSPTGLGYWFGEKISSAVSKRAVSAEQAVPILPSTESVSTTILPENTVTAPPPAYTAHEPVGSVDSEPANTISLETVSLSWQGFVFVGWLAAVMAMGLLLIQRMFFVKGLLGQSKEPSDSMVGTFQQCRKKMKIRRKVDLKLCPVTASPSVCGIFEPTILIPQNLPSKLNREDLRAILLHELSHIKRGDLAVSLIQTILQIVYFYNALLWLANGIIRKLREQAVDEMVLVAMGERAEDYPETLLNISRLTFSKPALSLRLIGVVESKKALSGRIKRILSRPFPKTAKLGILGLAAIIITAAILLPMAKAESGDKYKKVFNNGLTVELVGVHLRNAESKMWWKPDGSKLGESIETVDFSSYDSVDPAYEFVFKTSGDNAFKVESIKGSNVTFGVQVPGRADMTGSRGHIKESVRKTNIKIATPNGKWKTVVKSKGDGSVFGKFKGKTVVLAAAEKAGNDVLISSSDQVGYKHATRLIAIDKYGKELAGKIKTDTGVNNLRQRMISFTGLNPSDIAEFRFQTCPYEYHTFKNVCLKPMAKAKDSGQRLVDSVENTADVSEFKATLSNGVTVELVGVCEHPSEGKQWWGPDGSLLDTSLYKTTESILPEHDGYTYYEFAARLQGPHDTSVKWDVPGGRQGSYTGSPVGFDGRRVADLEVYTVNQPNENETILIRIGLSSAPWETLTTHKPEDDEETYTFDDGAAAFGQVYEKEGETFLPFVHNLQKKRKEQAFQVVAITNSGREFKGGRTGSGGNVLSSSTCNFTLPLREIREFQFQTRSYEYVTFKNVSLKPGFKTDLQIEVTEQTETIEQEKNNEQGNKFITLLIADGFAILNGEKIQGIEEIGIELQKVPNRDNIVFQVVISHDALDAQDRKTMINLLSGWGREFGYADVVFLDEGATYLKTETEKPSVQVVNPIDFEITKQGFLAGDSIEITEILGSSSKIETGQTYTIKGKYKLSSHNEAKLHIYATNGETLSEQGSIVKHGTGEFTRTFKYLKDGWLHLSFYPAEGGGSFGNLYFAEEGSNQQVPDISSITSVVGGRGLSKEKPKGATMLQIEVGEVIEGKEKSVELKIPLAVLDTGNTQLPAKAEEQMSKYGITFEKISEMFENNAAPMVLLEVNEEDSRVVISLR